jgi:type II secretory pathway component PulM
MSSALQVIWDEREPREKVLLSIMGVLLSLTIFWFFILTPILAAKSEAKSDLMRAERDYVTVSRALPSLGTPAASSAQTFNQAVLIASANKRNLNVTRIQPDGNKSLSVWIDTQDTQALYAMLNEIILNHGAKLTRATLSTGANQTLSAQLTFQLSS